MHGLMQEWPLVCHKIIDHAARQHPNREVVSRSVEGPIVRTTYAGVRNNAKKVAQLLAREGYQPGDRIATLAWNTGRHLEAWFGIMGMGGVYHTLNPRLFPRADRLDHEPCVRPGHLHRPDLHAACGEARPFGRIVAQGRRHDRRRPHARDRAARCRLL